jgi:predicted peroxiredoxin
VPRLLIVTSTGAQDPTRASIPFHIGVNGAAASGQDCGIALAGDATDLLKPEISERVRGVGVPPLASLLAGCAEKGIRLYV